MEVIIVIILAYVLFRVIIPGMKDAGELKQKGLYRTHTGGLRADKHNYDNGTMHDHWHRSGYVWHEEWKRWVPDITSNQNEDYWKKRGYRWNEKRGRWSKIK